MQRTPDEIAKWHTSTQREARLHGWLIAGGAWLLITAVLAGGWIASGRLAVIAQQSVVSGGFWTRFPIFAVLGLPIAYIIFRIESRRELETALQMTLCPKCETVGEANADTVCPCGGTFVHQGSLHWVDQEPVTQLHA